MEFRIADTFTDSLAALTAQEQKAVKTTAFDLQMDPSRPGMQFHRIDRSRDDNFWSVRVTRDLRLIVHKTSRSFLLCYVGHHDDAYDWAERRKIERHPRTGAAQIVEIRETVREVPVYIAVEQPAPPTPPLFEHVSDEDLLRYGVPEEWLEAVRAATEATVLDVAAHLPAEASEAVIDLAVGITPEAPAPVLASGEDPFEHPDAQRRFRTIEGRDELERALEAPWDKWAVFLHPTQRDIVTREYNGPARVAGSAGTGKSIVALHRAVHLAETREDARVLLTTFSAPLARTLKDKLYTLVRNRPRLAERIDVEALDEAALRLHRASGIGQANIASEDDVVSVITELSETHEGHGFALGFLLAEWMEIVDPWQLSTWEEYRDVARLGRKTRLPQHRREAAWDVLSGVRTALRGRGLVSMPSAFAALTERFQEHPSPYEYVVVDEAQDLGVAQLRFLASVAGGVPNGLFFAGDLGQRIFQPPFSWKSLGVDVRGRSRTLRINYRTSHQIRSYADRLLNSEVADVDGIVERRDHAQSVFNGPAPAIQTFDDPEAESRAVATWLRQRLDENVPPEAIGLIVRSEHEIERAEAAAQEASVPFSVLDGNGRPKEGTVAICTMHIAKGLEFRAVAVLACDEDVIPSPARIEAVTDPSDLQEVYDTERHLLYVACTRARDCLLLTGVEPGSEFMEDMMAPGPS